MFYEYNQNNSGGNFDLDEACGLTHFVVIEADSAEEANRKAEDHGIYFDGCASGRDCSCCGDRWYAADVSDGTPAPTIYGRPVTEMVADGIGMHWMPAGKEVAVHFKDGRVEWF
jgi:hypothetical protein